MKKAMIVVASMAFSGAAVAEGPAWTFVDAGVVFFDSGDDQTTGAELTGSFGLDMFHFNGSYQTVQDVEVGYGDGEDDFEAFRVGAGIHPAVTDNTDAVLELGYTSAGFDDGDADPDGFDVTLGVRSMVADQLELSAATVLTLGDTDTDSGDFQDTTIVLGGQYFFTDNISLSVEATDDFSKIGGRWSF